MNRKFIIKAGMTCIVIIIAGCSAIAQQDTSSSPDVSSKDEPITVEPSAEEINTTAGTNEVPVLEAVTAGADESVEEVAVLQSQPESDDTVTKKTQNIPLPEIPQLDNELAEGEYSWSQLLARDAIFPIYNPEFAPTNEASYDDNELVIGLEINGEAKAYAIGPLNGREMVNDTVGGIPVLVTW